MYALPRRHLQKEVGCNNNSVSLMIHNNARLLFGTCVLTPYELGFEPDGSNTIYVIVDTSFNFMFFIDIFVNFTSAYYDNEFNLIHEHKVSIV